MLDHNCIDAEHILLGLIHEGEGVAARALESLGISLDAARRQVEEIVGRGQQAPSGQIPFTSRAEKVFDGSLREALQLGHNHIGPEHILLALVRELGGSDGDVVAAQVLVNLGADLSGVRRQVIQMVHGFQGQEPAASGTAAESAPPTSLVLDQFGRNLTQDALVGRLDPVIGREKEIQRVMQVLSRRVRNNPVLVGAPGVGKTTVVGGLAQKIIRGEVPAVIRDKQLYTFDPAALIAGSRGQAEVERQLEQVLREIRTRGDILLFIDGIHALFGPGAGDASLILKPVLARGELQIIGATTPDEYRKYLEKDTELERLLQPIEVAELTVLHTTELLRGMRDRYEAHHRVTITDSALIAAVQLADQNLPGTPLLTKALDLIDEAGSRMQITRLTAPQELREYDEQIAQLRREKESAIDSMDFEKAAALRDTEKQLLAKRTTREQEWKASGMDVVVVVDEKVIAETLAIMSGVSSAGIADTPQSRQQEPPYPPAAQTDDDRAIWGMA